MSRWVPDHSRIWRFPISCVHRQSKSGLCDTSITESSPIKEGFYTTISWFSPIGCINYAWCHRSKLHTEVRKITFLLICQFHCGFRCFLLRICILAISFLEIEYMAQNSAEILTDSGFLLDFRGYKSLKGTMYKLPIQVIAFENEANLRFWRMESS